MPAKESSEAILKEIHNQDRLRKRTFWGSFRHILFSRNGTGDPDAIDLAKFTILYGIAFFLILKSFGPELDHPDPSYMAYDLASSPLLKKTALTKFYIQLS